MREEKKGTQMEHFDTSVFLFDHTKKHFCVVIQTFFGGWSNKNTLVSKWSKTGEYQWIFEFFEKNSEKVRNLFQFYHTQIFYQTE